MSKHKKRYDRKKEKLSTLEKTCLIIGAIHEIINTVIAVTMLFRK